VVRGGVFPSLSPWYKGDGEGKIDDINVEINTCYVHKRRGWRAIKNDVLCAHCSQTKGGTRKKTKNQVSKPEKAIAI